MARASSSVSPMVLNTCCWMSRLRAAGTGQQRVARAGAHRGRPPHILHSLSPGHQTCPAQPSPTVRARCVAAVGGQRIASSSWPPPHPPVCRARGVRAPTCRCAASRRQSPRRCTRGRRPARARCAGRRSARQAWRTRQLHCRRGVWAANAAPLHAASPGRAWPRLSAHLAQGRCLLSFPTTCRIKWRQGTLAG